MYKSISDSYVNVGNLYILYFTNIKIMYKDELSVFIPNSFLSESKDLKVRTFKVGILGRALAVFQIDNVVIYNDDHIKNENGEEDGEFIAEVLNYMNTPQYLRKSAFL